jgi:broad specificity phosphatase PhoE
MTGGSLNNNGDKTPSQGQVHLHPYDGTATATTNKHTKILHVIRHAEGYHNVNESYRQMENLDARLTPKGIEQCRSLNTEIQQAESGNLADLASNLELIVTSPLTRCIETTLLSLDSVITKATNKNSNKEIPIVAHESIRETVNFNCDRRRPISKVAIEYPSIDFSHIPTDHDHVWATYVDKLGCDETWTDCRDSAALHVVADRGREFFQWLRDRPEQHVAICTHSAFLRCILNFGQDGHVIDGVSVAFQPPQTLDNREDHEVDIPVVHYGDKTNAALQADYANCELRSMVVCFP